MAYVTATSSALLVALGFNSLTKVGMCQRLTIYELSGDWLKGVFNHIFDQSERILE